MLMRYHQHLKTMTQAELETHAVLKTAFRKYIKDEIDWEKRRYEIAKTVLPSVVVKGRDSNNPLITISASRAIELADELIRQLKETTKG